MASDARLLKASLRGDHEAFGRIVRRYQSLVCAITYSGTGDLAASEDLAQETFLTAWRRLGSLREPARLRAWLCTIARNLTADYLRRRPRDPIRDAVPLNEAGPLRSPAPAPAEHIITNEQKRLVWAALQDIPETYRVPLVLYYREQHSVRRVARALGLSRAAVKHRLVRGRGMVKGKLAALVEDTLSTTAPGSTFAAAVLAGLAGAATQKATGAGSTILGLTLTKAAAVGVLAAGAAVWVAVAARPDAPERVPAVAAEGGAVGGGSQGEEPETVQFTAPFQLHKDIPVGLVSGTPGHPKLAEVEWVRFETTYGNAWAVTARVGCATNGERVWRLTVELLDDGDHVLGHPRDEPTLFTAQSPERRELNVAYADLQLDSMHFAGRGHVAAFRVVLTPVAQPLPLVTGGERRIQIAVADAGTGRALPDAAVAVTTREVGPRSRGLVWLCAADAQGLCEIELPPLPLSAVILLVQKEGYTSLRRIWASTGSVPVGLPDRHRFFLKLTQPIGGVVADEEGKPLAGAIVKLSAHQEQASGRFRLSRSIQTDRDGRWRVEGVPGDLERLQVILEHPDYPSDQSYHRSEQDGGMQKAKAMDLVCTMENGLPVVGSVFDEGGGPIADAMVSLGRESNWTVTGDSGTFRFVSSGGASGRGAPEEQLTPLTVQAAGFAPIVEMIRIAPGLEPVRLELKRGRTITGKVVDEEGAAVSEAAVVMHPVPEYELLGLWQRDTDESGMFRLVDAPEHGVLLTVLKEGYMSLRRVRLDALSDDPVVTLRPAPTLRGRVLDADTREPIGQFRLRTGYDRGQTENLGSGSVADVTNADGRYELVLDEDHPYVVSAEATGYRRQLRRPTDVGGEQELDFELTRVSAEPTALHGPASIGDVREVKRLLAEGAQVNGTDDRRRTPLHLAAEGGHRAVVEALLEAGADVNATDLDGRTPAGLAVKAGHDELADLLREHGGVE